MGIRVALACLLASLLIWPRAAAADVYFRTDQNAVVHWNQSDVEVHVDTELISHFGAGFMPMLEQAADTWSVSAAVPLLHVSPAGAAEHDVQVGERRVWIGFGKPEQFTRELAITVSTTRALDGEVLCARVFVNPAVHFAMPSDGALPDGYDLQGVLTHELGHVLGLDEDEVQPLATMNPHFHAGDLHQRTLAVSDEDSVSELYRGLHHDGEQSGCSLRHGSRPGLGSLSLLSLALRTCLKRRRRWS
jgi:hypothetical protein